MGRKQIFALIPDLLNECLLHGTSCAALNVRYERFSDIESCVSTSSHVQACVAGMEDSTHDCDLIGELLVRAGMLMEDESGKMIRQLPIERGQLLARVSHLAHVAAYLSSFAAAAAAAATVAAAEALLRMRND